MKSQRLTAQVPAKLKRALASHCRRRGLRQNRVLAAIILAYLREEPHRKLRTITSLHDWETEATIRDQWRRHERGDFARPADGPPAVHSSKGTRP